MKSASTSVCSMRPGSVTTRRAIALRCPATMQLGQKRCGSCPTPLLCAIQRCLNCSPQLHSPTPIVIYLPRLRANLEGLRQSARLWAQHSNAVLIDKLAALSLAAAVLSIFIFIAFVCLDGIACICNFISLVKGIPDNVLTACTCFLNDTDSGCTGGLLKVRKPFQTYIKSP